MSDVRVELRLLPSRALSSLSEVSAPRNPLPSSVRPRMFLSDRAIPERSVRRSPPPSSSFSRPAPGAAAISPPTGTCGLFGGPAGEVHVLVSQQPDRLDRRARARPHAGDDLAVDLVDDPHALVRGVRREVHLEHVADRHAVQADGVARHEAGGGVEVRLEGELLLEEVGAPPDHEDREHDERRARRGRRAPRGNGGGRMSWSPALSPPTERPGTSRCRRGTPWRGSIPAGPDGPPGPPRRKSRRTGTGPGEGTRDGRRRSGRS